MSVRHTCQASEIVDVKLGSFSDDSVQVDQTAVTYLQIWQFRSRVCL